MSGNNQVVSTLTDVIPIRGSNTIGAPLLSSTKQSRTALSRTTQCSAERTGQVLSRNTRPNPALSSILSPPALTNTKLAAICSNNTAAIDLKVEAVVMRLLSDGYHVDGVLQKPLTLNATGCNSRLYRIGTDGQYNISQQLGAGSSSCNLDTEVLEQAAFDISNAMTPDTELVVVNRFGKREAHGGGFRSVFERASELDVPVLTIVQEQWASLWEDYGGDSVMLLGDTDTDLAQWIEQTLPDKQH